jgi:hypothetical protein
MASRAEELDLLTLVKGWARQWRAEPVDGRTLKRGMFIAQVMAPVARDDCSAADWNTLALDWEFLGFDEVIDYNDKKGKEVVERAIRGNRDANTALCFIALRYLYYEKALPPNLRAFTMRVLQRSMEHGFKQGYAGVSRDFFICKTVGRVQWLRAQPTRNPTSHDLPPFTSGCAMVAEALRCLGEDIKEKTVEDIWADRKEILTGGQRRQRRATPKTVPRNSRKKRGATTPLK